MIPVSPLTFWEYFDVISLGALTLVIVTLLLSHRKKSGSLLSSISKTVAYSPQSSQIFSVAMTVFFPLYYAFLWFWVGPLLHMPYFYYILLAIAAFFEMIFVWMPAKGKTNKIHTIAAAYVGFTMFILPLIILIYGTGLSKIDFTAILSFLSVSLSLLVLLAIQKLHKYTLQFEVIFCVMFLVTMSIIAHS